MAERDIFTKVAASTASPDFVYIQEIYPEIFYTNDCNLCDKDVIRAQNVTFVIMVDRIRWENKENFNPNGRCDKKSHETHSGTYDLGRDVETLDVTFGKPSREFSSTCNKVARLLVKAKTECQNSLIIDYNKDAQRSFTIVAAYLIYHETQSYNMALEILKNYNSKIKLNKCFVDILVDYESMVLIKSRQMKQNSFKIVQNVKSNSNLNGPKSIEGTPATCDPHQSDDYKEQIELVQHHIEGKPMDTFASEDDQEKNDYAVAHPYKGGAGEWNDSIHTDLFSEDVDDDFPIMLH